MTEKDRAMIADAVLRLEPLVAGARTAALITHITPDGDGIGAELCLLGYLKARGIEARVINTESLARSTGSSIPAGRSRCSTRRSTTRSCGPRI